MFNKLTYLPTRVRSLLTYNAATPVFSRQTVPPTTAANAAGRRCGLSVAVL